jgi:adenine-specific DNA-methyltransferase
MDSLSRFQSLLNEIFQFEASDLDFGIYCILNYKRDQIGKFIKEEIKNIFDHKISPRPSFPKRGVVPPFGKGEEGCYKTISLLL